MEKSSKNKFLMIKKMVGVNVSDEMLTRILFDVNRYYDKHLTLSIKKYQKLHHRIFNTIERKHLRNYFYYKKTYEIEPLKINSFDSIKITDGSIKNVLSDFINRCKRYDSKKIINSIRKKAHNLSSHRTPTVSFGKQWLKYYDNKRKKLFNYSSLVIRVNQKDFVKHKYKEDYLYKIISQAYIKLENYRNMFIVFDGQIFDEHRRDITWRLIYKLSLYSENFIQFAKNYFPCKKQEQAKILSNFIKTRFKTNNPDLAKQFYKTISTGFKFEDCIVSSDQSFILLSFKKIYLDQTPVPCPSCMSRIQSGNSYPEMFLRSFECKNPHCQERSKSGRGKRFDEYGVYRNYKLEENSKLNKIEKAMYDTWRRDIVSPQANWLEMIVRFHTWSGEKITVYNLKSQKNYFNRSIYTLKPTKTTLSSYSKCFNDLPIYILFSKLSSLVKKPDGKIVLNKKIEIYNKNSTSFLNSLKANQIGSAITSPPYYNAREYSQWSNLLLYLIDMMLNAKAVYNSLCANGKYLYNIGDIVSQDNIYVRSHMSSRRQQLGFLSCMVFELCGFNLCENIIWDKGEVQSKRNSTVNMFSGYVKCVNCYEHMFVFSKGAFVKNHRIVQKITPVIKINSKGINTYIHTAPYPIKLVNFIKNYLIKGKYILDPFLGSGTTLVWCKQNNLLGVGCELNKKYYELALSKIKKTN